MKETIEKLMTPERKTIFLNAFLAAAYTGLGASTTGLVDLGPTLVFSIGVGFLRAVIGEYMNRKGSTLPMDERAVEVEDIEEV